MISWRQIIRFVGVGGIATLLHSAVYSSLLALFTVSPYFANTAAYVVAVLFSYFGQKKITFANHSVVSQFAFLRFVGVSLFGFLLNSIWIFVVVTLMKQNAFYSLLGIAFLTPAATFFLLKLWVFSDVKKT